MRMPRRGEENAVKTYLSWILLFVAAQAALSALQFLLRRWKPHPVVHAGIILLKAVLAVGLAYLVMAGPVFLRPVQPLLVAVYAVLLPDAAADLISSLVCAVGRRERKFGPAKLLSLALGLLFFVYGTVNMQIVTPEYHTYTSAKLTQTHRVVFVSDLHVGSSQSMETTRNTIRSIQAAHPDVVILGGDITDDYTTKEEMEETYRLFGELGVPVYFIDGNHEVVQHAEYLRGGLPYTQQELTDAMERSGIIVLKDAYVSLSPDLLLLGREDAAAGDARQSAASLPNPAPDAFLLVADHQPGSIREHLELGADVQLSGHTHAGQLFPLQAVYSLAVDAYGDYVYGDAVLNVSAGASSWRVPFRTEAHSHFEVIDLVPGNG